MQDTIFFLLPGILIFSLLYLYSLLRILPLKDRSVDIQFEEKNLSLDGSGKQAVRSHLLICNSTLFLMLMLIGFPVFLVLKKTMQDSSVFNTMMLIKVFFFILFVSLALLNVLCGNNINPVDEGDER